MKKLFLLLLLPALVFLASCEEDCDCTESSDDGIYGLWERSVTDDNGQTFDAMLLFEENGDFSFLLAEEAEGHNNSFADFSVNEPYLTLTNDSDCDGEGVYTFSITGDELTLTADSDECGPRASVLAATWTRVE